MKLSIIIVTYNSEEVIKNCLKSIYENVKGIDFEVIIIDNDSKDQTVRIIEKYFPQFKLVKSKNNLGFAKGVNMGIKKSLGRNILLINPDMIILGRAVIDSINYSRKEKNLGILGCQFLYPDYTPQASFGNFPSLLTEFFQALFLHKLLPFGRYVPYNAFTKRWFQDIQETDWVSGGFMLIKRTVVEKIGVLDKNFFMYLEDIDYCRRARNAGFGIVYYPKAKVIHYHMESSKKDYARAIQNEINSLIYYFKKYKKDISLLRYFIYFRLYILIARYFITSLFRESDKKMMQEHVKALNRIDI